MAVPVESDAYKAAVASPELKVTSSVMMAAARHLAEACATPNAAFVKYELARFLLPQILHSVPPRCKFDNNGDPVPCVAQGVEVTKCAISL
jgi:hypothetical protein